MSTDIHIVFSPGDCPPHEQLLAYYKGGLSAEERQRIETHLAGCEMCSDELGGLSKMKDTEELPEIIAGIQSQLKKGHGKLIRMKPRMLIMAAAAIVVVIIGLSILFRFIIPHSQEGPVSLQMEKPVQSPPPALVPAKHSEPAGKSMLAVLKPREKKEENRVKEKPVPSVTENNMADEAPEADMVTRDSIPLQAKQKDTVTLANAAGYSSVLPAGTADSKPVVISQPAMTEFKKDIGSRSERQKASAPIPTAMQLYSDEDYQPAALLFEKEIKSGPDGTANRYYLSDCYYHLKEYQKASDLLDKILSDPKDPFYEKANQLMKKVRKHL